MYKCEVMRKKELLFVFFISSFLFFADRFVKKLLNGFSGVCNFGISFGMFEDWGFVLTFLGIFVFFTSVFFFFGEYFLDRLFFFGFGIFLAGGLSNFLDRLYFGCVRDALSFFDLFLFNISDILLCIGSLCMISAFFLLKKERGKT